MQAPRPFRFPRLALLGAAAVALGGCASYGGDYYSGPDTAYYGAPADGYYSGPRTTTYYDRGGYGDTYYAPAPRYSAAELHDYWYYPAVGCYYDPQLRVYLYFEHNRWMRARELPAHFRPHLGHPVTVRAPHGHPYAEHHRHRDRYAPERYRDDHDRRDRHAREERRERVWLDDPRDAAAERHRDDGHRARNEPRREDRPPADRDRAGQHPVRIERDFVGRPGREATDGHGRAPRAAAQEQRPEHSPAVQAAPHQRAQQAQDADRGRHRQRQDEPHGKPRRNDRPGQAEKPADQDQRAGARL